MSPSTAQIGLQPGFLSFTMAVFELTQLSHLSLSFLAGLPLFQFYFLQWGFPESSAGKESAAMKETRVQFLGGEDLLEKG